MQAPLHMPLAQVTVCMLFDEQTMPQPPQFIGSVATLVEQESVPLQSAVPVGQEMPQTPPLQAAVPLGTLHTWLQAPQLLASLLPLTSQPLAGFPSQSSQGMLQEAIAHCPLLQAAV